MPTLKTHILRWLGVEWVSREETLLALLGKHDQPNLHRLMLAIRDIDSINLNIKAFGYDLARRLAEALPPPENTVARHVGLQSMASTQIDIESDWVAHWASQLKMPVIYHRKIWEFCYVLQAIYEHGFLRPGIKALGFGCGTEMLPSYFAAQGISVTMTDLPPEDARVSGWSVTNQHTQNIDYAFHAHLADRATFDERVSLAYVDMNAIPGTFIDYDFCWSICAFEHLGSIENGLKFVENSLRTIRPGGLSVHTTELNIRDDGPTIDNWLTVLFQRKHFEALAERLTAQGHKVAPLDFDYGDRPMDKFIDLPPWSHDLPEPASAMLGQSAHLKLNVDGFPCTCFGLIIRKAGGE